MVLLPCADSRLDRPVTLCKTTKVNLHHLILIHHHIDEPQGLTDFLDFSGVVGHRDIPLSDIVELMAELQLPGRGTRDKNLF